MVSAKSLHLGLNRVDSGHYGSVLPLLGCHNDANDLARIAQAAGYESTVLLDDDASTANLSRWMKSAARCVHAGDSVLFTYSGHGGQVEDQDGEEADGLDETLVLYDRMFLDDELFLLLAGFEPGVQIWFISDSCHSGTNSRDAEYRALFRSNGVADYYARSTGGFRTPPPGVTKQVFNDHKAQYEAATVSLPVSARSLVQAAVIQLSACQDEQYAADGDHNGLFTSKLKSTWDNGAFQGNHRAFWQAISRQMPPSQTPSFVVFGEGAQEFERTRPFTLSNAIRPPQSQPQQATPKPKLKTGKTDMNTVQHQSTDERLRDQQKDLEHRVLRTIVETDAAMNTSGLKQMISSLRRVYKERAELHSRGGSPSTPRDASTTLMEFGTKIITEELSKIIASFDFLLTPAEGFVTLYNDTAAPVHVVTFDEKDAVRWVPYEDRNVASKQVVRVTARGDVIHIKTPINGNVYDCEKGTAYFYDGNNVFAKTAPL